MAKEVTINEDAVKSRIKVHLSIIGKRLNQKPGDKNYQNVTLTANEDGLIDDYFKGAVSYLAGQFPDVLITYDGKGTQGYADTRFNDAQNTALSDLYTSYILSYAIGSYLAMAYPDFAKKYQSECASYLIAMRNIVYTKDSAENSGYDYLGMPVTTFE